MNMLTSLKIASFNTLVVLNDNIKLIFLWFTYYWKNNLLIKIRIRKNSIPKIWKKFESNKIRIQEFKKIQIQKYSNPNIWKKFESKKIRIQKFEKKFESKKIRFQEFEKIRIRLRIDILFRSTALVISIPKKSECIDPN